LLQVSLFLKRIGKGEISLISSNNYYQKHRKDLVVDFFPNEDNFLREAQAGAFWAIKSNFTVGNERSIVVMPTGSGKTAVMTLTALSIAEYRTLVIAPSRVVRDQIAREFSSLKVAKNSGAFPQEKATPKVKVVEHQLVNKKQWNDLLNFDVIVSTPKCVSPSEKAVYDDPKNDYFDLILIDEAHHLPASTWNSLIDHFSDAKVISFTATPFRNDNQPIPGDIIYTYPLKRAIEKGIYRPIDFIPVDGGGDQSIKDKKLAIKAKEIWNRETEKESAKLLVRVGFIKETKRIKKIYTEIGLHLEIVTSNQTLEENEKLINKARDNDNCHGLIIVGMLGEGLDLPVLKIAVMHTPHQSFPVTLQFVGRICRTSENVKGHSKLIAIPEDIEEHTKGLYENDESWVDLIPKLSDAAVGIEKSRRNYSRNEWETRKENQVSIHTLRPTFTVVVYQILEEIDIFAAYDLPTKIRLYQEFSSVDLDWRVIITRESVKPIWTTTKSITNEIYDLHIYYISNELLFEFTTAPSIASDLRKNYGPDNLEIVDPNRIEQIVSQSDPIAYYNVGLRKVSHSQHSIPTYKMLAGSHAEETIRSTDGNFFSIGHLLGKVPWFDEDLVVGFSTKKGKIWSSKRDHIQAFTIWCDKMAEIINNERWENLPFLSHLKKPEYVNRFPSKPFTIQFDSNITDHMFSGMRIEVTDDNGNYRKFEINDIPKFEVIIESWDEEKTDQIDLLLYLDGLDISLVFDISEHYSISLDPESRISNCTVTTQIENRAAPSEISDYFKDNCPFIYLVNGGVVEGNQYYAYSTSYTRLPEEIFFQINWDTLNCDTTIEDIQLVRKEEKKNRFYESNSIDVLQATSKIIDELVKGNIFSYFDHGTGEIADIVVCSEENGTPKLNLIHCKAMKSESPGTDVANAYDVIGQAIKSLRWLRKKDLFESIIEHASEKEVITGSINSFIKITEPKTPQVINYAIYIVQPGFSLGKINSSDDESLKILLLSLFDELRSQNSELFIVGSE
jgi:superfamily II DNA or RNA helicase